MARWLRQRLGPVVAHPALECLRGSFSSDHPARLTTYIDFPFEARARNTAERLCHFLIPGERLLDIGAGDGLISSELRAQAQIDPVLTDTADRRKTILPLVVSNGYRLPFADAAFDVALLVAVLHHVPKPELLLGEAVRVARRLVIVQEDVYRGGPRDLLLYAVDFLSSLRDRYRVPSYPRTPRAWLSLFAGCGLAPCATQYDRWTLGVIHNAETVLFCLEPARGRTR